MRILSAERLRFPGAGSSAQGKSGPKARPKGVVDGEQVEIPVLRSFVNSEGGTQEAKDAWRWKPCLSVKCGYESNACIREAQGVMRSEIKVAKVQESHCQEKLLVRRCVPVPQTDTGSRVENTQVSERTLVKELGKIAP